MGLTKRRLKLMKTAARKAEKRRGEADAGGDPSGDAATHERDHGDYESDGDDEEEDDDRGEVHDENRDEEGDENRADSGDGDATTFVPCEMTNNWDGAGSGKLGAEVRGGGGAAATAARPEVGP